MSLNFKKNDDNTLNTLKFQQFFKFIFDRKFQGNFLHNLIIDRRNFHSEIVSSSQLNFKTYIKTNLHIVSSL